MPLRIIKCGNHAKVTSISDASTTKDINQHLGMIIRHELVEFDEPKGERLTSAHLKDIESALNQMSRKNPNPWHRTK